MTTISGPLPIVLKNRPEFIRVSKGTHVPRPAFILQGLQRSPHDDDHLRVGYTCSKKVGNAVMRNRAKRRLREAARAVMPKMGQNGYDYVLVGRARTTAAVPMSTLIEQLTAALTKLHA